jgi:tetratricopeptide (TPR) repeat protein
VTVRLNITVHAAIQSARRPTAAATVLGAVLILLFLGSGCSQEKKAIAEIQGAFEEEDYREAIAFCRHAIREGITAPEVYYYYGASLISVNRDFEGFTQLEAAVRENPLLSTGTAEYLFDAGERSFRKRLRSKAAKRMRKAVEIDPALDLGPYLYLVADVYFGDNDYERAAQCYSKALSEIPDTTAAEQAYLNMASAYAELGTPARAMESLEQMLEAFPNGHQATQARWRLVNLMYEEGEKQFILGNYEESVEVVGALLKRTRNPALRQKSRFLLGETYERMGEFELAYHEYRKIIESDRGASGRIVERARQRIAALREAGLY